MSSGYFSQFSQKKKSAEGPRPASGPGAGSNQKFTTESTASWPTPPGSPGPSRNPNNFKEVKQAARQHMADDKGLRVSKKISKLRHEGEPPKKAVAMALNMEREGRLTESGGYKRVKK